MWKCKNTECGKIFHISAKISIEKKPTSFTAENTRTIVEKACCPFCESIDFELVEEKKVDQSA